MNTQAWIIGNIENQNHRCEEGQRIAKVLVCWLPARSKLLTCSSSGEVTF